MPRNQGLAVEMTLRGRKTVILTARSSRCPRSLETRTERGFPHFHSNGCGGGPICQNYKTRQNRKGLQILVQNRKGQDTVKLSTERKHLTNILKMVAFQIESDLVEMIRPHYKRAEDEGRTLVQTILQDAADIEPAEGELRITLAPLSSPHRSRVVESLCAALNKTNTMFPGTQLQMRFAVAQPRS
jgi:hypothetical protein